MSIAALLLAAGVSHGLAQDYSLQILPAKPITLPLLIDSNTPSFWQGSSLRVFTSTSSPLLSTLGDADSSEEVRVDSDAHFPMWIESVWTAGNGALYAWYHHERMDVCPGTDLNVPEIGALVSYDGGKSFNDLGIILNSGAPNHCLAKNGYFANGHGDFSVIPDRAGKYIYFLFGAYGGDLAQQGVAIARMSVDNLASPVGNVWKYFNGRWSEPGLGGDLTPVFQARARWQDENTDSFWGPSIHWNTYLEKYVVLMNRSCCSPGWPQEGVYLTSTADLADPSSWSKPAKIIDTGDWYPWVLGTGAGETSSEAGQVVRLFVRNSSTREILFHRSDQPPSPPDSETESQNLHKTY